MRNILFIILIGITGCKEPAKEREASLTTQKKTIPSVRLTDLDGQSISLEQFKGKTVFLNFWATWCKPCIQEMHSIKSAQDLLTKKGVVFLLASDETADQINEFKKMNDPDLNFIRLVNPEELNLEALPATYIFSPKGELVYAEAGYRKWDDSTNVEMITKINNQK